MASQPTIGLIVEVSCPEHVREDTIDRLAEHIDCRLDLAGGRLLLTCYLEAAVAPLAARRLLDLLDEHAPDLIPLRLDDDLVAASDIAARLGITRQAVAQFVQPSSGFPSPVGTCASARVWRWAEVNEWLREHRKDRADGEHWPTADDAVVINAMLLQYRRGGIESLAPSRARHPGERGSWPSGQLLDS